MMDVKLSQFLVDVTRGPLKSEFQAEEALVIQRAALPQSIRAALLSHDIGALWRAGAHPMALLYYSRLIGCPMDRYYACIGEANSGNPL